jgi:hypothetical protein
VYRPLDAVKVSLPVHGNDQEEGPKAPLPQSVRNVAGDTYELAVGGREIDNMRETFTTPAE